MTTTTEFRDWLDGLLTFYGDLGFFAGGNRQQLLDELEGSLGPAADASNPKLDLLVMARDGQRSILESPALGEALAPGNNVYVQMLEQLASISRGHFQPVGISEVWKAGDPISIEFTLDGELHKLHAEQKPDRSLDENILFQLDLLLLRTGFQFEMVECTDDLGSALLFLALLNEYERFVIERERKIPFSILSLARLFRPLGLIGGDLDVSGAGTYSGTVNEFLDRSVGRLELVVEGEEATGRLRYDGTDHREDLEFRGTLDRDTGALSGQIGGRVANDREEKDYTGVWSGRMEHGGKVLCGTWKGWLAELGDEEPPDKSLLNLGEWALLHNQFLAMEDAHLARVRAWLEEVWRARSLAEYPWCLPPGS
ncbi:MAG: hypothetical protein HY319_02060 [Armatimonadetes bacterium]|nr:hypothetical protein [Armatimonadota bacterium]